MSGNDDTGISGVIRKLAKRETWEDLTKRKTWEDFFYRTPCIKSSYLWGTGCGSLMVAHKLRLYRGNLGHAFNAGLLTFMVVSSISFWVCADEVNRKYATIRQAMANQQKIKEDIASKKR